MLPGMLSNTRMYIVSGLHAVAVDESHQSDYRSNGRAVYLDDEFLLSDGSAQVAFIENEDQIPYGVLMNSQSNSPKGYYDDGDGANVVTYGKIYMVASQLIDYSKVLYGKRVFIRAGYGSATTDYAAGVSVETRWYFTGVYQKDAFINEKGELRDLVEVMVVPGGKPQTKRPDEPKDAFFNENGAQIIIQNYNGEFVAQPSSKYATTYIKSPAKYKIGFNVAKMIESGNFGDDLTEGDAIESIAISVRPAQSSMKITNSAKAPLKDDAGTFKPGMTIAELDKYIIHGDDKASIEIVGDYNEGSLYYQVILSINEGGKIREIASSSLPSNGIKRYIED